MLALLSLLVAARVLLLVVDHEWIIVLVKIILALLLLQLIGVIVNILPYS